MAEFTKYLTIDGYIFLDNKEYTFEQLKHTGPGPGPGCFFCVA